MATSSSIIREARLRAGLSQQELGDAAGRDRTQIARWERDVSHPSFETLLEVVRACGFDIAVDLVAFERPHVETLQATYRLTPQERLDRMLERSRRARRFRPDEEEDSRG
jgi:transcriptional regulator with XRE-family HTH domain